MSKINTRMFKKDSQAVEEAMRLFRQNNDIALLARKMGRSQTVMLDKLNPDREQHKLCLLEAVALTELSGDTGLAIGFAHACGLLTYEPPADEVTDHNIVSLTLKKIENAGRFSNLLDKALEDQILEDHEIKELDACLAHSISIITCLRHNLARRQGVA